MRYFRFIKALVFIAILFLPLLLLNNSMADERAPDFSLPSIDGTLYTLSKLKGRIVIVNFWATWCQPCLEEMPALDTIYKNYRDKGLLILGISIDRKKETVEEFIEKNPVSYPILLDQDGNVFVNTYVVTGLPATYIIDRDGRIVEKYIGKKDFISQEFLDYLEEIIEGGNKE